MTSGQAAYALGRWSELERPLLCCYTEVDDRVLRSRPSRMEQLDTILERLNHLREAALRVAHQAPVEGDKNPGEDLVRCEMSAVGPKGLQRELHLAIEDARDVC